MLTATVTAGGASVTRGQVMFCDALATMCSDIHVLATVQLTPAGIATLKFVPGIGSHSYKAVFLGRFSNSSPILGSFSSATSLVVTGTFPTRSSIVSGGVAGNYSLAATVTAIVNTSTAPLLGGSISFYDRTNNNYVLSTPALSAATAGLTFVNSSNPATVPEPNVTVAADFNGDGIPDLAVSNSNSGGTQLSILLGNGDGTFTATTASPTVGLYPDSIVAADFNGDGIADIALTSAAQNLVTILLGNGDGTFRSSPNLNTTSTPQSVATEDFDGDGIADLAVTNTGSVLVFLGNGDGTFKSPTSTQTGASSTTIGVADLNKDGVPDLAVVNNCGPSYPCNNSNGTVSILLGRGDGTFTPASESPVAGPSPVGLVIADFNGDGAPDLAVSNYGNIFTGAVSIFLGNGDGTFQTAEDVGQGIEPTQLIAVDFNGDGVADLAYASHWSEILTILLGKGDGTFGTPILAPSGAFLSSGYLASADFNGDGVPDVAVPDQKVSGTIAIQLTQPTLTATASASGISVVGTGTHQIDAIFAANAVYGVSASPTTPLTAKPLATSLNLNANPGTSTYGQQVVLKAALAPSSGQNHSTDGELITFYSGSTSIGTAALSSGVSTLNLTALPIGKDTLTASFPGGTNFVTSGSNPLSYNVARATPTVSLAVTPNPAIVGSSVTLTAIVSSTTGAPTGSVVFSDGSTSLGTVALSGGSATLSVSTLVAGNHSISVAYQGDSIFSSLTSSPASEVVQDFAFNGGSSALSQTIQPGGRASYTIPIGPVGVTTFENAISFTVSGLPAGATATFSPATINAGSSATNVALSVQVPQQTAILYPSVKLHRSMEVIALSVLMLPFWGKRVRRGKGRVPHAFGITLIFSGLILVGLIGCSGGGNGSTSSPPPPQTFALTVTASSNALSETVPVTLTVQ